MCMYSSYCPVALDLLQDIGHFLLTLGGGYLGENLPLPSEIHSCMTRQLFAGLDHHPDAAGGGGRGCIATHREAGRVADARVR